MRVGGTFTRIELHPQTAEEEVALQALVDLRNVDQWRLPHAATIYWGDSDEPFSEGSALIINSAGAH